MHHVIGRWHPVALSLRLQFRQSRVRLSLAALRSRTFAMAAARTGAAGSASKTAASCPRPRFASTPIPSRARRRNGSRSMSRCSPSLVYGPLGAACEGRRARQLTVSMSCSAFSRQKRMPSSPPIHPKAMPVILTTPTEIDLWLLAGAPKALELQRPLPDDALRIASSGEKEDGPAATAASCQDQEPMLPL
jgi:hypothetical protein